ncbi:hypothetical protein C8R44DRAFT_749315 [Mycena epipterygia]|nr:hypothetical protein C8R44DRAFT_749315 [Mycena epipterygia]
MPPFSRTRGENEDGMPREWRMDTYPPRIPAEKKRLGLMRFEDREISFSECFGEGVWYVCKDQKHGENLQWIRLRNTPRDVDYACVQQTSDICNIYRRYGADAPQQTQLERGKDLTERNIGRLMRCSDSPLRKFALDAQMWMQQGADGNRNKLGARAAEKTRRRHTDDEEVQDVKQNLAEAQPRLKLAQAEQKSNSSGRVRFRDLGSAGGLSTRNNLKSPPTHLKPRLLFRTTPQSISALTSPEFVAAAAESQTATPAQPPRKRLKLASLKAWGVQRDGVAMSAADYAKNHWDEFKEEYPEYAKAVLSADSDE